MEKREEVLQELRRSIETWNTELAKKSAREALALGIPPAEAIEQGLGLGMASISQRFDEATIFLPHVLAASTAMEAAMKELEPAMNGKDLTKGTVVIGTVHGDIHEIGKNVVAAMLRGAGYRVVDLGRDVPLERFIETAKERKAHIIGASALMTTTMVGQKVIVELLEEENMQHVKTIFGGAPCSKKWVESFNGGCYCPSGAEAVAMVDSLMKEAN
jgi:corrinoid protein of di/trimethylamine methyltransferase